MSSWPVQIFAGLSVSPEVNKKLADAGDDVPFYFYFGLFIATFAVMEKMCHWIFHSYSGLNEEIGRAFIGGEQLSKVTRLMTVLINRGDFSEAQREDFQGIIDQINTISTLRHALIHRGMAVDKSQINVSNITIAKSREAVEVLKLNIDDIKCAIADLVTINLRFAVFREPALRDALTTELRNALNEPWRYTHIAPEKPFRPPRKDPQ